MVRQKLFVGSNYANGLFGKKILVVGHQKHATAEEREKSKNDSTYQYTSTDENVEMLKELCNGTCMSWKPNDRKSWLQFGKLLSGDLAFALGTKKSTDLWQSIAFCNYLQVPDFNLDARQGKDEEEYYHYSEGVFKEYLEECKPDKIIVWGEPFKYISRLGNFINECQCQLNILTDKTIDVLKINHPCRIEKGGYDVEIKKIKDFLLR